MTINLGDIVSSPADGWQRFDNENPNIEYIGDWSHGHNSGSYNSWNNGWSESTTVGSLLRFNFTGPKLLIRSYMGENGRDFKVTIDGEVLGTFDQGSYSTSCGCVYINESLDNKEHYIEIEFVSGDKLQMDAFDIVDTGDLKPYNPNLEKHLLIIDNQYTTYENNRFIKTDDFQKRNIDDLNTLFQKDNLIKYDMNYNKDESGGKVFKKEINKNLLKSIKSGKFSFNL